MLLGGLGGALRDMCKSGLSIHKLVDGMFVDKKIRECVLMYEIRTHIG